MKQSNKQGQCIVFKARGCSERAVPLAGASLRSPRNFRDLNFMVSSLKQRNAVELEVLAKLGPSGGGVPRKKI